MIDGSTMHLRGLWHYVLGIVCAVAVNGILVMLLVVTSQRDPLHIPIKASPQDQWLKLASTQPQAPLKASPTLPPDERSFAANIEPSCSSGEGDTSSRLPVRSSLETEIFFQKGQELLASFNSSRPEENAGAQNQNLRLTPAPLDPAQFYVKHAMLHILPYQKSLYKKYAKLRRQRSEHVERHPSLQVTVNKDGALSNIFLKESSGSPTFDKFYIQAVKQASPLPKIPAYLNVPAVILEL